MSKLWIVSKNEFYRYFISPLAYVYLISFLILNGSFAIYFGHFFERGQADLLSMFSFQPWLYLLFIPGIAMRLWSEEFRSKTILQITTMPISLSNLVWGKFFAAWSFCALALILTFPFWITVNILGQADNSVIFISYIGSFLLAGCMLAISQTMSALTKNQVIALVLAVITNLLFFLSGIEYVLGTIRNIAPLSIVDMIASFSFLTHFESISQGLVEARDLVFFTSIILLFNFTTIIVISFRTAGTSRWLKSTHRTYYILAFFLLMLGFTGINLLANNLLRQVQYDFTQEKIFTLTPSTKKILQNLPEPVTARLYYSRILGERNPEFRLMFDKVRLLLQRYARLSDGKFTYQIYYPEPLSQDEDRALANGLQPMPIIDNNSNAYFGLVFSDEVGKKQIIPFFPLQRQNLLEQDLSENIYRLNLQKKKLGILTSLPMFEEVVENVATSKWEIVKQLENFYDIIKIDGKNPQLQNLDALIIAHPLGLSESAQKSILDYSYQGGKILAFLDVAAEAPRIFSPANNILQASDIGNLPTSWGFAFNSQKVVGDLANSSTIDATTNYKSNPNFTQDIIQFYLQDGSFNQDFKETALLKKMLLTSAATFNPLDNNISYFIPLLQASDNSELLPANVVYDSVHPADILRNFTKDGLPKYIAARIISKDKAKPFELIVVGDSDLLYDNFWTTHQTIFENNYSIPILDNANFVFNALDVLTGNNDLIGLRGKSRKNRAFTDIENTRKLAQQQFKIKEKEIMDEIEHTKLGLHEIWGKKNFEGRDNFTSDELAIIANVRKTLEEQRRQLFEIRSHLNHNIENVDTKIKFFNIYALPLLIIVLLGVYTLVSRPHHKTTSQLSFNRQLAYLGISSLVTLSIGILSIYLSGRQEIADYEGQKVFSDLPTKINDISQIKLQSNKGELTFYQKDGLWNLQGHPHLLVYQDRIRSFLSALLEATYLEKKSAKIQNLALFGLAPIEVKNSPNIRVELLNQNNKVITGFEVGKFDIDLGRGTRGAFLKFDNQFQVWLADIDLIDLSVNSQEWTFSTIWNLRFGRFASVNNSTNIDDIVNLAKELLNIHFLSAPSQINDATDILNLDIVTEDDSKLKIKLLKSNQHYFISYEFLTPPLDNILQLFQTYVSGNYYEISQKDAEKLINVSSKF